MEYSVFGFFTLDDSLNCKENLFDMERYRLKKTLSIDIDFEGPIMGYDLSKVLKEKYEKKLLALVNSELKNFKTGARSVTKGSMSLSSATYLNPLKDEKTI